MTALQSFATHSFANYAAKNIRVDQDKAGLFCQVPSQDGRWYTVRCMESKKSVYANHCSCSKFATHQHCEHVEMVQAYWNRIYKVEAPEAEAPKAVKVRKPRNGLVRKTRNGGLVKVEQKVAPKAVMTVAEAENAIREAEQRIEAAKVIKMPVQTSKITDISTKGELYSNRGFQMMR